MNGHRQSNHAAHEPDGSSQYPDPTAEPTLPFSFLAHYPVIPYEEFPRAQNPLIFEGFIPDQPSNGIQATHIDLQSSNHGRADLRFTLPIDQTPSRLTSLGTPFDDGEDDDQPDEQSGSQINGESDYDSTAISGVYKGTRSKTSGNTPNASKKTRRSRRTGFRGRGGWSKGFRLGPRPALEPSEQFNTLHLAATNEFIDHQNHEKALDLILQAIAINPEVYSAHALLSEIHFAQGEDEKAVAALFSGAHAVPRDPAVWQQVADVCLQRTTLDRQTALQQALYCYSRLLHIDPEDHDVRFQRAAINRELGNYTRSLRDLQMIQKDMPHNSSVLRQLAELYIEIRDIDKAKTLYEELFDYHKERGIAQAEMSLWSDINVYIELFSEEENYEEGATHLTKLARWLLGREAETCWNDISDDREWDAEDDPRRSQIPGFQPNRFPRDRYGEGLPLELRIKLGLFRLKLGAEYREDALRHLEWLEPEDDEPDAYLEQYPDLFQQAAQGLYEAKEHQQALRYFEPLRELDGEKDVQFWLGIATSSYMCGKKDEAIQCFETAKANDPQCAEARTRLSRIYAEQGLRDLAIENAREAMAITDSLTQRTDRRKYERKETRIARRAAEQAFRQARRLPVAQGEQLQAYKRLRTPSALPGSTVSMPASFTLESAQSGFTINPDGSISSEIVTMPARAAPKKKTIAQNREAKNQERVVELYATLLSSTKNMRNGDETATNIWMDCAQSMTESFRAARTFFPPERGSMFKSVERSSTRQRTASGIEASLDYTQDFDREIPLPSIEPIFPTEHHGIDLSTWLDIFLEYALLLARSGKPGSREQCYAIITAAQDCAPWYQDIQSMMQIYTCYVLCALSFRDEYTLFTKALRWFMRNFQFCTDTFRLFAALNLLYPRESGKGGRESQMASAVFRSGPNQKYLFRQIMSIDTLLPEDYDGGGEGPVPAFMRRPRLELSIVQNARDNPDDEEEDQQTNNNDDEVAVSSRRAVKPKEMDIVLLTLYGHILYAGNSFSNALSYFYRAYTLDPTNPMVLLSISLSYMHQIMKRQSDDRHRYFLQGWAFFEEYADARMEWAKAQTQKDHDQMDIDDDESNQVNLVDAVRQEIEFNRARCWHMLGMADLAVRGYQKLFTRTDRGSQSRGPVVQGINHASAEASQSDDVVVDQMDIEITGNLIADQSARLDEGLTAANDEGGSQAQIEKSTRAFTMEAAYAIQTIYALNGNAAMARSITERYLVI